MVKRLNQGLTIISDFAGCRFISKWGFEIAHYGVRDLKMGF
jgi:hypothetical protein